MQLQDASRSINHVKISHEQWRGAAVSTESSIRVAVVGLGYVGLPLALEFAKQMPTLGFDINPTRIEQLRAAYDANHEVEAISLQDSTKLNLTNEWAQLSQCNVFVVTVNTPIDEHKRPDFSPLRSASTSIGKLLKKNDVVIYESTVYPGATEEICVPELEAASGLIFNQDFFVGYSPERINPGDKKRSLVDIPKVTSGSNAATADFVDALYQKIIKAGTHKASSIKVAEASKVIENTQRDVNIALMNEFALIFNRLGIDTHEALAAAGTKWNFLPFTPGLVGGHCIGVDPYYLIQKAQSVGYYPDVLLASRRINDAMGQHVAAEVLRLMVRKGQKIPGAKILMLGLSFKENCSDLRNTRVVELIRDLSAYGAQVDIYDPCVDTQDAKHEYGLALLPQWPSLEAGYDAVIIAVAHQQFVAMGIEKIQKLAKQNAVIYDIKAIFPAHQVDGRL
jgi:UDP-N-acetyl-D-glucosamine/UDP-N-acetyl-D-galactosamine dehydrogenase